MADSHSDGNYTGSGRGKKEDGEISGASDSDSSIDHHTTTRNNETTRKRHRHESSSSTSSSGSNSSSSSSSSSSSQSSSSSSSSSSNDEETKAKRVKIMSPESAANFLQSTSTQKTKEPESVVQYLMRNLAHDNNERDFSRTMIQTPNIVAKLIVGKQVVAKHTKVPIKFVVSGITPQSADRLPAFFRGPTVAKYIQQKQNITLKHPEWPCAIQRGGGNHQSFYPIELLFIF